MDSHMVGFSTEWRTKHRNIYERKRREAAGTDKRNSELSPDHMV